jgi:hypothetical protein
MRQSFWKVTIVMAANSIMVHTAAVAAPAADTPSAAGEVAPYAIKSTYATPETCDYKTEGVFIVWWDKKFDYATQAVETLKTLESVRDECLGTYHMSDPPNPQAGYYYNVYLHNGSDLFKPQGWAMGQGTDENRYPYLTIPIGYATTGNSGLQHEGFHIFQYKANSPGFVYRGDSQWFIEATANWYAVTKHPQSKEGFITASAVTANPQVTMWYTYENREPGEKNNWQRCNHLYGMHIFLNYLTDVRKVPKAQIVEGFYAKTSLLPQEYLSRQLGAAEFARLYADFAAHNVSGFPDFPAGTEARAAVELKNYGDAKDVHPIVQTYANEGTGGNWVRPPKDYVTRGWGYNVYRISNTAAATYTFHLKGDENGSEGAAAAFQGRVVVRTGAAAKEYPLTMSDAATGQQKVEVAATDADVYLIVAATPACFRGNQTYLYEVKIDRN